MKRFEVIFRPQAEADLFGLYRYIAAEAGLEVAAAYIGRIEAACLSLETFPERGTRRDDIRPGLRTMGFEGRVTIVFLVKPDDVEIVRIFYGGRDFEAALRSAPKKLIQLPALRVFPMIRWPPFRSAPQCR